MLRLLAPRKTPDAARLRLVESHVGKRTWEPYTLLSIDPERHSQVTTDVLCDQDGRLYSPEGHPLVDYNALYAGPTRQGVPILRMLQTVKGPTLFATSLTPEEVNAAHVGLVSANSYVTAALTGSSRRGEGPSRPTRGESLGERADHRRRRPRRLADHRPGQGVYLVQEVDQPAPGFIVSAATLKLVHSDLTAMITGPRAGGSASTSTARRSSPTRRTPIAGSPTASSRSSTTWPRTRRRPSPISSGWRARRPPSIRARTPSRSTTATAAIGAEVLANRLGVGPMGNADAVDLKFEEFFLSSWAVGDPAMVVDVNASDQAKAGVRRTAAKPLFSIDIDAALVGDLDAGKADGLKAAFAKAGITLSDDRSPSPICVGKEWIVLDSGEAAAPPARPRPVPGDLPCDHDQRQPATALDVFPGPWAPTPASRARRPALYPDDPSNVYHSNIRDHVKFRILHAGPGPSHVHHLHAHQWLHSPDSSDSQYLDSQLIIPGSAYTLEIVYNGSGNRNLTVGDSIFHCHFYPHFAKGMWSLWRSHDVFEWGTRLDNDGRAVAFVDEQDRPVYRGTKAGEPPFFIIDQTNTKQAVAPDRMHRSSTGRCPTARSRRGRRSPRSCRCRPWRRRPCRRRSA